MSNRRRSKPMTAAELMAKLKADPEWVAADLTRREKRAREKRRLTEEQAPLLRDLARIGYDVSSVWDLVNSTEPYPEAIPVLMRYLREQVHWDRWTRAGIARALTVKEARELLPDLIEAFRQESDSSLNGPKWCLGNAIEFLYDDKYVGTIAQLILDPSHGEARQRLVLALKKSKSGTAERALRRIASEPSLAVILASEEV